MLDFYFFFSPWKSLQVEHTVHFQTVILKPGEADPCMISKGKNYCFCPSPLKKALQMLGELMTVNDTMFFEYFKLPGNKKVDSGKERGRKEGGRRFYLVLEKVVKEVILWREKAPQSKQVNSCSFYCWER